MKTKILILLIACLLSASAFACGTTLHLDTNESHWYSIKINNKTYPDFFGNIDIYDIPAGTHKVKIERYKRYRPDGYSPDVLVFKGKIDFPYCGDVIGKFN